MRIVQVLTTFDPAAGGPVQSSLGVHLAYLKRHEVVVLGTSSPRGGWRTTNFRRFRHVYAPYGPRFVLSVSLPLELWIFRNRASIDMLHIHLNRGGIAIPAAFLARVLRKPYVVQTHGMCKPWTGMARLLDRLLTWPILNGSSRVLVLSEQEKEELEAVAPRGHYEVVHNALVWTSASSKERPVDGTLQLLFCARLHPRKSVGIFVQICAELMRRGVDVHGRIVGPDEGARAKAAELARELTAPVTFVGPLDAVEVRSEMQRADIFVHPAPQEPFGMSMLEAMANDVPVVAASSSFLAPLFGEFDAAVLVPDEDVAEWVRGIAELQVRVGRKDELTRNARRLINERFSVDALAVKLDAMVDSLSVR